MARRYQTVLSISGFDPTAGAGVLADAEAIRAAGCHPLALITANTIQDSNNIHQINASNIETMQQSFNCLKNDFSIDAIKIGMLANENQIHWLIDTLSMVDVPIVLDPILAAGGGFDWLDEKATHAMKDLALVSTITTPNAKEQQILGLNQNIFITDTDDSNDEVKAQLITSSNTFCWKKPKYKHTFHGTGCTLASFLAAELALGKTLVNACENSFNYVHKAISQHYRLGHGQLFFRRNHHES